jgi:hypothetical protein
MTQVWYATVNAGKFRRGQVYVREQLGVLGRMAVQSGVLIPYEQAVPVTRKKGARRGKAGTEAGGGQGLRDTSGA